MDNPGAFARGWMLCCVQTTDAVARLADFVAVANDSYGPRVTSVIGALIMITGSLLFGISPLPATTFSPASVVHIRFVTSSTDPVDAAARSVRR